MDSWLQKMTAPVSNSDGDGTSSQPVPQMAVLDFFFPGFSSISSIAFKYLGIDLNVYIPLALLCGGLTFLWRYFSEYIWDLVQSHLMSTVEIRTDDEIYNIIMNWIANQHFSKASRRFIVNTNLSSRSWFVRWTTNHDDDEDDYDNGGEVSAEKQRKTLSYTPSFGTHTFWYRGRLLLFRRSQNRENSGFLLASENEEISVSCFGRSPWILKELLVEAKMAYMTKDAKKTLIYRGTCKSGTTEPTWQRCLARSSRPFSTVILNEAKKQQLIDDVADYLDPATRRWYANRGIPYRRGYLLYGPPGTGKSSISLALAGHFKMRIYIVSLSSMTASEENLATLFAELPRRCVVLLEDIDTAGLTHTRDDVAPPAESDGRSNRSGGSSGRRGRSSRQPIEPPPSGRLSLSGLLNLLDGVASQEGRILIMTTNHIAKLDSALIRPGRIDMMIEFGRADCEIAASIFKAIFATLEADTISKQDDDATIGKKAGVEDEDKKAEEAAKVEAMAGEFAAQIPEHEFSPAEIQGFLLKHKRSPAEAVAKASEFVVELRKQKKEAELREAEKKREEAEKEKEKQATAEKKIKDKDSQEEATKKATKSKKKAKAAKEDAESDAASGSESGSGSESESDSEESSGNNSGSGTESSIADEPQTPGSTTPAVALEGKEADANVELATEFVEVNA